MPAVHVALGGSRTESWKSFFVADFSIRDIILAWAETVPSRVQGKSNSVFPPLKQLGVVLHHALKSCRRFEHTALSVGVLWIHEFWNNSSSAGQVLNVLWNLKYKSIRVPGEKRESFIVSDITKRVPLVSEKGVELVVLYIDNNLLG